jgi:hypothetical protein
MACSGTDLLFMIYHHAEFHVPYCNSLLFIAIRPEVKYKFLSSAMTFYIVREQNKNFKPYVSVMVIYISEDIIYQLTYLKKASP